MGKEQQRPLRILMVEDVDADAERLLDALQAVGIELTSQRVNSEPAFQTALRGFVPDLVIANTSTARLTPHGALEAVQRTAPQTPVIVVTDSRDEGKATQYIEAGAVDAVAKAQPLRLGPAVKRALALRRVMQDATAAKGALLRTEHRFRKLVEYSRDVVTLLDRTGRIVYSSQSVISTLGYATDELTGQSIFSIVHPEDSVAAGALFGDVVQRRSAVQRGSLRVRHKDGSWRDLEVVAADHLDDPVVRAVVVNSHDVTERKRAEAALRRIEEQQRQTHRMEAIGRLAGGIAHDFNNLLTVITSYGDMLLEDLGPTHASAADVEQIRKAALVASRLTRQLLAFSRQQVLEPQSLSVNAAVVGMREWLTRLIGEDIVLSTTLAADLGAVKIDPGQLDQVIMNLAVNARDAMPTGGTLTIATSNVDVTEELARQHPPARPGSYVRLVITDDGIGMDEATRSRIFEPFFTTKEPSTGTGLGLATVYGIVKQCDGFIRVCSEPGKGSTFEINFPRAAAGAESWLAPSVGEAPRGTETVLLAEDAAAVRSITRQVLQRYGYNVLEAPDGDTALSLAARHHGPIHLLLTDVVMPKMTGRQLAERLTELRPALKVLYMSGYANDAIIRHGVLEGGIAYLQKPFTTEALARRVREVIDA